MLRLWTITPKGRFKFLKAVLSGQLPIINSQMHFKLTPTYVNAKDKFNAEFI